MEKFTNLILTLAAAVLALASCDKMPVAGMHSFLPNEIYFSDGGITIDTKAFTEATNKSLQDNGFNVAALIENGNITMFNKAVTYSDGAYSVPGEQYFFPAEGTMSFYAVYPKTQNIIVDGGAVTLSYSQNADTDLIAARKTAVSGTGGPVTLAFGHLLSQVSITVKGIETAVDYKVKSVKIICADSGTYAFASDTWTLGNTTAGISIYENSAAMPVSSVTNTPIGSPVSVIPGTVKLNVVWDCYNKSTSTLVCSKDVTVDVALAQGMHSTLYLTLPSNSSEMSFNTTVKEWMEDDEERNIKMINAPETVNGVFTVNDSGKKVKFTKGNLYWNGREFLCEANQYDYPITRNAEHIGHFYWSKDASVAFAASYSDEGRTVTDKFFAAEGGAIEGFTILSNTEWDYLFTKALAKNSSSEIPVTIDGKKCMVLKPDGFSGTVADTYTGGEWAAAEASGLVAIPFAGAYANSSVLNAGTVGFYWTSTPVNSDAGKASYASFMQNRTSTGDNNRSQCLSVRLVSVQ